MAPGFGLGQESLRQRRRSGAKRFYFYAGIFRFEGTGDLLVLLGGQRGVPDDFALPLSAVEEQTLAIRAGIGCQFGRRQWLAGLAPRRRTDEENEKECSE